MSNVLTTGTWSRRWLAPVLGMIVSAQAQPPDRSAILRITVVGQANIHSDLRKSVPAVVDQARKYVANADVANVIDGNEHAGPPRDCSAAFSFSISSLAASLG
jgi:hypothetical protein